MSWESAIYNVLTNDAALTALLAPVASQPLGSVIFGRQPPHTIFPYLVYFGVGAPPPEYQAPALSGKGYVETQDFQVTAYAENDPATLTQIAKRVDQLLNMQPPAADGDVTNYMSLIRTSAAFNWDMEEEASENDNIVYSLPLMYQLRMNRVL